MRVLTGIIGVFTLAILAITGASASFISFSSENVGSGDVAIVTCDSQLTVSFGPPIYEPAIPGFKVSTVSVSDIAQDDCQNAEAKLQLTTTGGVALGPEKVVPDIDSQVFFTVSFVSSNIPYEAVRDVHVTLVKQ